MKNLRLKKKSPCFSSLEIAARYKQAEEFGLVLNKYLEQCYTFNYALHFDQLLILGQELREGYGPWINEVEGLI